VHHHLPIGFARKASRTNFVPDAATMPVVRRIFRMIGIEGYSIAAAKKALDAEEIPTPGHRGFGSPSPYGAS